MSAAGAKPSTGPAIKKLSHPIPQMDRTVASIPLPGPGGTTVNHVLQTGHLQLLLSVVIGKPSGDDPVTIFASLDGSTISSGKMFADRNDERGFFQDRVTVRMSVSRPDLIAAGDGPSTQNGTAHTSSSTTLSFNTSAGLGFFGPTPTGNVSVGAGYSLSNSFSRDLTDFRVENHTLNNVAVHDYIMAACSGSAYTGPSDLIPSDVSQFVSGVVLRNPPPLATANLPLISQASWQANHNDDINAKAKLHIEIEQICRHVWGQFPSALEIAGYLLTLNGPGLLVKVAQAMHAQAVSITYSWDEPLPLDDLIAQAGTVV